MSHTMSRTRMTVGAGAVLLTTMLLPATQSVAAEEPGVDVSTCLAPLAGATRSSDVMQGWIDGCRRNQAARAAVSLGISESATQKTIAHLTTTRYEHLNQTLAEQPTNRVYLARMKIKVDLLRALLGDALAALETGRADAMLRVLESKAAAGEIATEVTDLAMRLCGGAAFRKEVGVERNFRDARAANVMAPTTDALYDFIGKALTGLPLFG